MKALYWLYFQPGLPQPAATAIYIYIMNYSLPVTKEVSGTRADGTHQSLIAHPMLQPPCHDS